MGYGVLDFRRRRASGAFSPLRLFASGEEGAWYDPSDLSTLFQDSAGTTPVTTAGQPVGRMLDKSGRGNHATQATSAARPTYQTGAGLHYLAFDGVDDFMATGTITPNVDKLQAFAGVRKLSDAATGFIAQTSDSSFSNDGAFGFFAPSGASATYGFRSRGTSQSTITSPTTFAAPITNVVSAISDIAADNLILRVDSVQAEISTASQGTGNYLPYTVQIGARATGVFPLNGNLYGLIIRFGANLTDAQITSTETYLATRTGVTL